MMKRFCTVVLALLPMMAMAQIEVTSLRVNQLDAPMGIAPDAPVTFSWMATSSDKGASQSAYEVSVHRGFIREWYSGVVKSDNSTAVRYEGRLYPDSRYTVTVRIWDNKGRVSNAFTSSFQTGLRFEDWKADMIGEYGEVRPLNFRRAVSLNKKIKRATAYISSHGVYEAYINGHRVGDAYMTPGWTTYKKRLQYQAYDVTTMLCRGDNVVAATVAPAWYTGMGRYNRGRSGDDVALLMQINIEYTNGEKVVVKSDDSWRMSATAKASGLVKNDIYDGATIDARLIDTYWSTINYSEDSQWQKPTLIDFDKHLLVASVSESVKAQKPIKAIKYIVTPAGEKVIDFGQNLVGWERAKLQGKAGDTIRIYHAETLDENGNFYTTNLRKARATSTYVMDGEGKGTFATTQTFYGFRYIKVEGVDADLNLEDFEAVPVWSSFDNVGSFSSSNPLVNQLQSNIW